MAIVNISDTLTETEVLALMAANPEGTEYIFPISKVYRGITLDSRHIKNNDTIRNLNISGGTIVGNLIDTGNGYYKSEGWNVTVSQGNTDSIPDYTNKFPRANWNLALFVDDIPHRHVSATQWLTENTFHYDTNTRTLYVSGNPTESTVVFTTQRVLINTNADNITYYDCTFLESATRVQEAGVYAGNSQNTTFNDCTFKHNAGRGLTVGSGVTCINCQFVENGHLGVGFSSNITNATFTGCVFSENNFQETSIFWESGGTKVALVSGYLFDNCSFVSNKGNGLWIDISNSNGEVRDCYMAYNYRSGLYHEISYDLYAHDNVFVANGIAPYETFNEGDFRLSNSSDSRFENNIIISAENAKPIFINEGDNRENSTWISTNAQIKDNHLFFPFDSGRFFVDYYGNGSGDYMFNSMVIDGNTYHKNSTHSLAWRWDGIGDIDFNTWSNLPQTFNETVVDDVPEWLESYINEKRLNWIYFDESGNLVEQLVSQPPIDPPIENSNIKVVSSGLVESVDVGYDENNNPASISIYGSNLRSTTITINHET